jgi:hypothetical protein
MGGAGSSALSSRDRALLRAIAVGRCRLGAGWQPVLLVDGLACSDSLAGQRLVAAGLVQPADSARPLGPAVLTRVGREVLAEVPAAGIR